MSRSQGWLRRFWTDYAIIVLGAFAISLLVARAGAVACVLAAPPLAWQLRRWLRAIRSMRRPVRRIAAMATVAMALMPTLPALLLTRAIPAAASQGEGVTDASTMAASGCRVGELAAALSKYEPGEVFAPLDISPYILFGEHTVVATSHHRGNEGMRVVIANSLASPENARRTLAARGTDYVALCSDLIEPRIYANAAPAGFIARVMAGERFAWLEPLPVADGSSLQVWRVTGD